MAVCGPFAMKCAPRTAFWPMRICFRRNIARNTTREAENARKIPRLRPDLRVKRVVSYGVKVKKVL